MLVQPPDPITRHCSGRLSGRRFASPCHHWRGLRRDRRPGHSRRLTDQVLRFALLCTTAQGLALRFCSLSLTWCTRSPFTSLPQIHASSPASPSSLRARCPSSSSSSSSSVAVPAVHPPALRIQALLELRPNLTSARPAGQPSARYALALPLAPPQLRAVWFSRVPWRDPVRTIQPRPKFFRAPSSCALSLFPFSGSSVLSLSLGPGGVVSVGSPVLLCGLWPDPEVGYIQVESQCHSMARWTGSQREITWVLVMPMTISRNSF